MSADEHRLALARLAGVDSDTPWPDVVQAIEDALRTARTCRPRSATYGTADCPGPESKSGRILALLAERGELHIRKITRALGDDRSIIEALAVGMARRGLLERSAPGTYRLPRRAS